MVRLRWYSALAASAILFALIMSCAASPPPRPVPVPPHVTQAPATPAPPPAFDPAAVPEETKKATFTDVRSFVDSLNQIIRQKNFDAWRANLTDAYIKYYSDPTILYQFSQYPVIKNKGIELKTLKDFFLYVVYPARQNDRVDDIEFIRENLVKAITISPTGDRNILYILEKQGDTWKIGIGR
ncbi:MAG: hypothetical protein M0Z80_13725 [Treponema sp.]|nr:hypothetical protein [Treponema sp.]